RVCADLGDRIYFYPTGTRARPLAMLEMLSVEYSSEGLHQERQKTPTSDLGAPQNLSPWAITP
ncbi:hypothetical protein SFRURICE_016405, partial [Spodoptera frugiperda]